VEIPGDYKASGDDISAVFSQQQRVALTLRVFVDFLVSIFNAPPWNPRGVPARLGTAGLE